MEGRGKVAVIGSGLIGRSWAAMFCKAGFEVCMYDNNLDQLTSAVEGIKVLLNEFYEKGLVNKTFTSVDNAMSLVSTSTTLQEAVKGALFVQESIPENLDLKKSLFKELDNIISGETILSSSSSCLFPSLFTKELVHKAQCLVSHPVNPPYLVPLVEIIPAPYTNQSTIDETMKIMKAIGQHPVLVKKEVNGFILNRLQYAVLMEAWRLVEDGICSPEDVDTVMTQGLGLRYSLIGPFETIHLNAPNGVKDYCERYGGNIEAICREQESTRCWSGPTMEAIHQAMCEKIPLESLNEKRALRDQRLSALAVHHRHYRPNSFSDKNSWGMKEKDVGKELVKYHSALILTDVGTENKQLGTMEPRQVILKLEQARSRPTLYSRFINNNFPENVNNDSNNNSALNSLQHESEELYATVTKKNQPHSEVDRANSYLPETNQERSRSFSTSQLNSSMRCNTIKVPKNKPSIGISISGGKCINHHRYIRIVALHPGGAADETNLEIGQIIISVDGTSLLDVTHEEAVDLIRSSFLRNDSSSMELSVALFDEDMLALYTF